MYQNIKIYKILMGLIIASVIHFTISNLTNFDLLEKISIFLDLPEFQKVIYALLLGISVYFLINRNFYLPFLGNSVYPCGGLSERTPQNSNKMVQVNVKPNVNVIYWASENFTSNDNLIIDNPWDAYGDYDNYGVVKSNDNGNAVLTFRNPVSYKVPSGKKLDKHVHYRYCLGNGMMSEVKTIYL